MSFQFLCPQGHLLQGDPSQQGMQTQCPLCGLVFVIPHMAAPGPGAYGQPQQYPQQYPQQHQQPQQYPQQPEAGYPGAAAGAEQFAPGGQQAPAPQYPSFDEPSEQPAPAPAEELADEFDDVDEHPEDVPSGVLHIPCPNGHELETPYEMLDQEVLCPHCGAQFLLREEDSVEHHEHLDAIDRQRAHLWFNWAIAAAVIVVAGMLAMVIVAMRS